MTLPVRQATQRSVRVGPFVRVSGVIAIPVTSITLSGADQAEILKAGGAAVTDISSRAFVSVSNCAGWYDFTLSTTDTSAVGDLEIVVQDQSACLPVHRQFVVVEEAVYDDLYASSAGALATASAVTAVLTDTSAIQTTIGAAGASLSAIPWNADWDTEVQSECNDALVANKLDHLLLTNDTYANMISNNTVMDILLRDGFQNTYDQQQHSLMALSGDIDEVNTTANSILTDTSALQITIGAAGASLSAIPVDATIAKASAVTAVLTDTSAIQTSITSLGTASAQTAILTDTSAIQTTLAGLNDPAASAVAASVWGAAKTDFVSTGTIGEVINDLDDTVITGITEGVEGRAGKHSLAALTMIGTNATVSGTTLIAKDPSDDASRFTFTLVTTSGADPITGVS